MAYSVSAFQSPLDTGSSCRPGLVRKHTAMITAATASSTAAQMAGFL